MNVLLQLLKSSQAQNLPEVPSDAKAEHDFKVCPARVRSWESTKTSMFTPLARDLLLLQIQTGLRDGESIRKQMDKVRNETRIAFTHHCLRRTFAALLRKTLEVDVPTIAALLNHSPQGVTHKHNFR